MRARIAFLAALAAAAPASAQTSPAPLDNVPTSSAAGSPICTDRPTKSNFACTVPAGMIQIESDVFSFTRLDDGGVRTDVLLYTNPTFKYGLGSSTDIEANIAPLVEVRSRANGRTTSLTGVGDLILRVKQRFTPTDGALQFSLIPYVKVPTAKRGIGNKKTEGGVIAPANLSLPGGFTFTVVPSLDVLADGDGDGRHVQLTGLVNLGKQFNRTTLYGEFWTAQNYDPAGTVRQYSADVAVAHLLTDELQIDIGGNFGLNRVTPDVQLYVGISARF